jgi:uncharacterized membrane protein
MGKLLYFIFVLLILAPAVSAYSVENLKTEFYLFEHNQVIETEIMLSDYVSEFEWPVAEDADGIEVYADGVKTNFTRAENKIIISLQGEQGIRFSYISEHFVDNENFLLSFTAPADINRLEFRVILPEKAVLTRPLKEDTIVSGSVYPKPSSAVTDGRSLIFTWLREDFEKGREISIFVAYRKERVYANLAVILVLALAAALGYAFYANKRRPKVIRQIIKEDLFDLHLKEDEEIIVNVLKKREKKQCEQGTLRIITGFSKATLSRILSELEARKIIKKEKRGKKNIIFLK